MLYSFRYLSFAFIIALCLPFAASALELQSARGSGSVGEEQSGYITAVAPSAEVNKLVAEVNSKRKQEYERISKENGQPVNVVAKLAAEKIIQGLPTGAMYRDASGNWKKK